MSDAAELAEFHRIAARAIGQRQLMLAMLNLPRDIDDKRLGELLGTRVLATEKMKRAAQALSESAKPNLGLGDGVGTWSVPSDLLRTLNLALDEFPKEP